MRMRLGRYRGIPGKFARLAAGVGLVIGAAFGADGPGDIEFDHPENWQEMPIWTALPAQQASLETADGVAEFSIKEPGRAMKWVYEYPTPLEASGWLIVRYRALNLADGDYALWVMDDRETGGLLLPVGGLLADGQWHILAVDLRAAGVEGDIRRIALQVRAGPEQPASLGLDYLRHGEKIPDEAQRYPSKSAVYSEKIGPLVWVEDFATAQGWQPRPGWLANPDVTAAMAVDNGALSLKVPGAGRGMKWSKPLLNVPDLKEARYVAVRYRAKNLTSSKDYLLWIGNTVGGAPSAFEVLLSMDQIIADDQWHLHVGRLASRFTVAELAIQVQAGAAGAEVLLDELRFTSFRPLRPMVDVLPHELRRPDYGTAPFVTANIAAVAADSSRRWREKLGLVDWFTGREIRVDAIPFDLIDGEQDVAAVSKKNPQLSIPLNRSAREIYLLMATSLPSLDHSGLMGTTPLTRLEHPEQFAVRLRYADGTAQAHFPLCLETGKHEILEGLHVYGLGNLRETPLETVTLEYAAGNGGVLLAALTLNDGAPRIVRSKSGGFPVSSHRPALTPQTPLLTAQGNSIEIDTTTLYARFDLSSGLRLLALRDKCLGQEGGDLAGGSFFELGSGNLLLTSDRIRGRLVGRDGNAVLVEVDARPELPLAGSLRMEALASGELLLDLDVRNVSAAPLVPVVNFPTLPRFALGSAENTWYFYPSMGGVISRQHTRQRRAYGGNFPLQVMGAFNPELGGGLYLMVRDLAALYKYYGLDKNDEGVALRVEYLPREILPGATVETAQAVIGGHTGDWRAQFSAYRRWAQTWYQPLAARQRWVQDIYNYRQHYLHYDFYDQSRRGVLYDAKNRSYRMGEAAHEDQAFFGKADYLHIFDFGHEQSALYGRTGDYSHYEQPDGLEKLATAIAGVQDAGFPVGVYLEGYLCDERSLWGRRHVEEGHILGKDGTPLRWGGGTTHPEHFMCPGSRVWQRHLAGVYSRVSADLKPRGMYIDQLGICNEEKICYARDHGHPVPSSPLRGEQELCRALRQGVTPGTALFVEYTPADQNSQLVDGALSYSITWSDPVLSPHRVDFFHFAFPDFKIIQLHSVNRCVEGGWPLLKFPFFNGEGWWLCRDTTNGFEPAAQEFLRKALALLHDHAAAFRAVAPEPLVPTLAPCLYANMFPAEGETVWTIYNDRTRSHEGPVLEVEAVAGATYRDLWNDKILTPSVLGGKAVLSATLQPKGIGCLSMSRPVTPEGKP